MRAYVFPGQGSQQKGMGASLFDEFEELTRVADAVLGYSVKTLCLEDPDNLLDQTQYTQPALYVVNALSYYHKLRETGSAPDFVAGHSLGEFNALLAAEAFDFETGLRLVQKRGQLMAEASGGAMAAVLNASEKEIRDILEENHLQSVDLANFNTSSEIVLSGRRADIEAAEPLFQAGNHLFVRLKTSGAFHSRYMEPARAEFDDFLSSVGFSDLRLPVVSNVTARDYEEGAIRENLANQMVSIVRWSESMEYLLGYEDMEIEELGHGNVLTKLVRKIRRELGDAADRPVRVAKQRAANAEEMVRRWNEEHPVGTPVRSTVGDYGNLETSTEAVLLFGHRAAVYMRGYRGYFDLNELEPVA
ncbi:ACP S-malonyltransferase [Actinopolyspora sp. H202]|uniref:ACP S-malonyltransferase n=1 Tax=Actinopolyspora sp. H202 TaxID=1500456 RepID=UPI003EE76744